VNAGNIDLLRGEWNRPYVEELRQFPAGKHDDQVDASAGAFNDLADDHTAGFFVFDH
jgi:predicted phage terminase large subunit-like protein